MEDILEEHESNFAQRRLVRKGSQGNPDGDAGEGVRFQHFMLPD
jgi:hypothetical protein